MEIGIEHYLTVAAILFSLGIFGIFLNRKNIIIILMSIELILLAVNINLVAFSSFHQDLVGQIFAMFVLTVARTPYPVCQNVCLESPSLRHHRCPSLAVFGRVWG